MQHGVNGRVGRTTLYFGDQRQFDSILAKATCKTYGIGISMNDAYLRNLYHSKRVTVPIEEDEKKEYNAAVLRAGSCISDIKMISLDKKEKQEGLKLLKSCAESGDGYGLMRIGMLYDMGLEGYKKDEELAKKCYSRSEEVGFSDASLLLLSIRKGDKLNPENEEWYPYFLRLQIITSCITELDLSRY